jgi:hypothetical protein
MDATRHRQSTLKIDGNYQKMARLLYEGSVAEAHMTKQYATAGREDISRFMVHLTRDFEKNGGKTARQNLISILLNGQILAANPHCFFNDRVKTNQTLAAKFAVACFTEVPLNQIHLLSRDIPGRQVKLKPYGIVFTREFIVSAGGQPALYLNGYGGNQWLHESVTAIYNRSVASGKVVEPYWRILPFINAMHERYDFTWEREWRVLQGLKFKPRDIVCVILPPDKEQDLKEILAGDGIATVSPGWGYEEIVAELAKQQRTTRKLNRIREMADRT